MIGKSTNLPSDIDGPGVFYFECEDAEDMPPPRCPICREPLETKSWFESPHGIVETWEHCWACDCTQHTSYGETYLTVGARFEGSHSYADSKAAQERNQQAFRRAVRKARRTFIRTGGRPWTGPILAKGG